MIGDLIGVKKGADNIKKSLGLLSKAKGNEEKRHIESSLLKPDKIPRHTGKTAYGHGLRERAIYVLLPTKDDFELFCKHFRVSMLENRLSTHKTEKLIALLKYLDTGKITYDEKTHKINETTNQDNTKRTIRKRGNHS